MNPNGTDTGNIAGMEEASKRSNASKRRNGSITVFKPDFHRPDRRVDDAPPKYTVVARSDLEKIARAKLKRERRANRGW